MAITINNKVQYWLARVRNGPVGEFFTWWWDELKQLLPEPWQDRLRLATRRLSMQFSESSLQLGIADTQEIRPLQTIPLDQDTALVQKQLKSLFAKDDLNELPRYLLLDSKWVLQKELKFPAATETNLRQVLSFEMDRQTPFRANEVYFDWRMLPPVQESGEIRLDLLVVPRRLVDPMLEKLTARGLTPAGIDVEREGRVAGVNLLPADLRHNPIHPRARLNYGLAAAVVVLLVTVMVQSLGARADRIIKLEEAIAEVQDEARRVQRLKEQVADNSEAASFLTRRRSQVPLAVDVLAEVTQILPDGTYLDRLVVGNESVIMQGKSGNAQQLIELVNRSEMFDAAAFQGSTRLDAGTGLEIFEVNSKISSGQEK
ncbi:MAG TPA: PilN domain-containing protein [Xanthomonadales bacterium]|nr:PilN domain-containing protein [Xanthomonadales bacterium]